MTDNVTFQLEVTANAGGEREITKIECEPTTEDSEGLLEASQVDDGAWEFRFVIQREFDGSEAVFKRFARYRLDPKTSTKPVEPLMRLADLFTQRADPSLTLDAAIRVSTYACGNT